MTAWSWPSNPNDPGSPMVRLRDKGQQGNILLSKLRAYYTFRTLDTMMKQRSPVYAQLARQGRIVLDAEGYGKYREDGPDDDPMSRRIEIYLDAVPLSQVAEFKRMRGGAIRGAARPLAHASTQPARDTTVAQSTAPDTPRDTSVAVPPEIRPVNAQHEQPQKCYSIQFCSILDEAEAQRKVQLLEEGGIADARVEPFTDRAGQQLYRVRSGCFVTADEAGQALSDLEWTYDALSLPTRPVIVR